MSDFCIFGLEVENDFVIFEINTLEFVKNAFLAHTVNFGIGQFFQKSTVRFCRRSGSAL